MDIQTKDGIVLRGIPDGTPEEAIKARIAKIRAEGTQAPAQAAPKPKPGFMESLKSAFSSPLLGGGPIGAIGNLGMKQIDQAIDRGAVEGGGVVTDMASRMGASPEVAAGAGVVGNMGVRSIPTIAGALAGKLIEPVTRNAPVVGSRAIMQSALKPSSKDLASGDAAKAIDTMLDGGFNVTPGGVAEMRALVKKLSGEVDDLVNASPGIVKRDPAVRAEMVEQLKKFREQVNPTSDLKAIRDSWAEFKRTIPPEISVARAQALKKGTYGILADKYANLGTVGDEAGTQSQMALARGMRKSVEQNVPGALPKNKRMQELINAMEMAEGRSGIAGNRDIAGIALLANHPVAGAAMLADRNPWFKSILARYLHSGMPATGAIAGTAEGIDLGRRK